MILSKAHYFQLFQVDPAALERLVREGLRSGGSYCDLYFEYTRYGSLLLRDGAVTSGGLHQDFGVGIRVLSGEKTGYAYSESADPADWMACARAAAQIADRPVEVNPYGTRRPSRGEPNPAADRYPAARSWFDASLEAYLPFLQTLEQEVRSRETRVVKVMANLAFQESDYLMYNSQQELKWDTRPLGSVSLTVVFRQGERTDHDERPRVRSQS